MKIRRVTLTEEPYPKCIVSGKQLKEYSATFEVTRDDGTVVYIHHEAFTALRKTME